MPQTPAQMARALNFGRPNAVHWIKADTAEYPFPMGWYQIFQVTDIEIPTTPEYQGPTLDLIAAMRTTLGFRAAITDTYSRRADMVTEIEMDSPMTSSRISRSTKP